MLSVRIWRHFDILLLASVALLTIAGVAMIRSATAGNEELAEQVVRQAVYAALGLVGVLAAFLARHREELSRFKSVAQSMLLVGAPAGLVFLQPNLSTAIVFLVIWMALVWAAGIRSRYLLAVAGLGLVLALVILPLVQDYQKAPLGGFLF